MSQPPSSALRAIPSIAQLLALPQAQALAACYTPALVTGALRRVTDALREDIRNGAAPLPAPQQLVEQAQRLLVQDQALRQHPVINATGVLLHTNLGRAPMAGAAAEAARQAALHYTNLEFDCQTGSRGDRLAPILAILREVTGAEDAVVVNNNAAAMLLALSCLAQGQEVVVSRGELVEIGGSFRVPEVMAQSGCTLREVGATNKTRLADYEGAIGAQTAALMKVHCSNYQIIGFTQDVGVEALAALAHRHSLPLLHDAGSGALLALDCYGLAAEPTVSASLAQGADVVCFSGDKLLGGPQAGIIVGKTRYLAQMKKHPLMRALRADKMTLAALEATLKLYRDETLARQSIPLYRMLGEDGAILTRRAGSLLSLLPAAARAMAAIVPSQAQVGGGSAPGQMLPSVAVAVRAGSIPLNVLAQRLMRGPQAVIARIHQDSLLLDMRTVQDAQLDGLAQALQAALLPLEGA